MATGPNDRLLDAHLRQALDVWRFARGRAGEAQARIDQDLFPVLLDRLAAGLSRIRRRGPGSAPWETVRYGATTDRVHRVIRETLRDLRLEQAGWLRDLARVQARWLQEAASRSGVRLDLPDLRAIVSVASEPIAGRTLGQWWAGAAQDLERRLGSELVEGLAVGESDSVLLSRARRQWARTQQHAEAITRTATSHVAAQVQQRVVAANRERFRGVIWVSTLDSRTSKICLSRHGRTWPIDRGPRPPAHPNCRSVVQPLVRGAADPELVSADAWLRSQGAAFQDEVLGRSRGVAFRAGELDARSLTNMRGRVLTLDELEERRLVG